MDKHINYAVDTLKFIVSPLRKESDGDVTLDYYNVTTDVPLEVEEKAFRILANDLMRAYIRSDRAYFKAVQLDKDDFRGTWSFLCEVTTFGGSVGTKHSKTAYEDAWCVGYDRSVFIETDKLPEQIEKREFFRHRWFNGGAEEWFDRELP